VLLISEGWHVLFVGVLNDRSRSTSAAAIGITRRVAVSEEVQ
jgi:hypothetical protein